MADDLTLAQYAAKIGNTPDPRTLREWAQKGIISSPGKSARGKGNHWEWTRQILAHYKSRITEGEDLLRDAKIRSENARAQKMELQIQETEGELVRAADVVAVWSSAFSVCKNRFMGLAVTLVDDLAGITDKAIALEIIQDAIQEILEELGSGGIVSGSGTVAGEIEYGIEAAAETDG